MTNSLGTGATPEADRPKVRLSPPPAALMKVVNPFVRPVLRSRRLGQRLALQALLEFVGRRTGRRYRVPACVHDIDGVAMVFTERPWRLNFAGGVPVTVTQRGQRRHGRGELLAATPLEVGRAMRTALDNGASAFELGLKVQRGYEPTIADLSAIPRHLIRIDFED
jgi:hypothetical protein